MKLVVDKGFGFGKVPTGSSSSTPALTEVPRATQSKGRGGSCTTQGELITPPENERETATKKEVRNSSTTERELRSTSSELVLHSPSLPPSPCGWCCFPSPLLGWWCFSPSSISGGAVLILLWSSAASSSPLLSEWCCFLLLLCVCQKMIDTMDYVNV